jgi:hypothetical protein
MVIELFEPCSLMRLRLGQTGLEEGDGHYWNCRCGLCGGGNVRIVQDLSRIRYPRGKAEFQLQETGELVVLFVATNCL